MEVASARERGLTLRFLLRPGNCSSMGLLTEPWRPAAPARLTCWRSLVTCFDLTGLSFTAIVDWA